MATSSVVELFGDPSDTTSGLNAMLAGMSSEKKEKDENNALLNKINEHEKEDKEFATKKIKDIEAIPVPEKPTMPEPPKQEDFKTPAMDTFGSGAMMLATLGSLLTRHPLTTALNSAAAVNNAAHTQDEAAFTSAYQKWKDQTSYALKLAEWDQTKFKDALDKGDAEAKLHASMTKNDAAMAALQMRMGEQAHKDAVAALKKSQSGYDMMTSYADDAYDKAIAAGKSEQEANAARMKAFGDAKNMVAGKASASGIGVIDFMNLKPEDGVPGTSMTLAETDSKVEGLHNGMGYPGVGLSNRTNNNPAKDAVDQRWTQKYPNDDRSKISMKRAAEQKAELAFEGGGKQDDIIKSQNVAIDHMAVLRDLSSALQNGDVQLVNKVANNWAEQTGQTAPSNFDSVKLIVGDEIAKAVIGGVNAQSDRQGLQDELNRAKSPEQLQGVIDSFTRLMVGQIEGNRRQYMRDTPNTSEDFDRKLSPETLRAYNRFKPGDGSSQTSPLALPLDGKYEKGKWYKNVKGEIGKYTGEKDGQHVFE